MDADTHAHMQTATLLFVLHRLAETLFVTNSVRSCV